MKLRKDLQNLQIEDFVKTSVLLTSSALILAEHLKIPM